MTNSCRSQITSYTTQPTPRQRVIYESRPQRTATAPQDRKGTNTSPHVSWTKRKQIWTKTTRSARRDPATGTGDRSSTRARSHLPRHDFAPLLEVRLLRVPSHTHVLHAQASALAEPCGEAAQVRAGIAQQKHVLFQATLLVHPAPRPSVLRGLGKRV